MIDKTTKRNIPSSMVTVKQSGSDVAGFTTSDDGVYFLQVPPGAYSIEAVKRGFKKGVDKIEVASFETVTRDINLVPVKTGTDAKQTVKSTGAQAGSSNTTGSFPGFVKGEILDKANEDKIFGATVALRQLAQIVASTVTQDDGVYFFQVPPGSYDITVVKDGFNETKIGLAVSAFETVTKNIILDSFTPTPMPTPTPAVTPIPTSTPVTTPAPTLESVECNWGGIPTGITLSSESLTIKAGRSKIVRIRVLKEEKEGCSTGVSVQCIEGCDKIQPLNNTITTKQRGFATLRIKAERNVEGISIVLFSVGNIAVELPVVIE